MGIGYSLTGCIWTVTTHFLICAIFIAGSLTAVPNVPAMEELLVGLNSDMGTPSLNPKTIESATQQRGENIPSRLKILQSLRNKRFPELTSRHIVIIAIDKKGETINPSTLLDPRLIRAEIFSPESGQNASPDRIDREKMDFIVKFPKDTGIDKIQFYHPRWTGKTITLELIGETQVQ